MIAFFFVIRGSYTGAMRVQMDDCEGAHVTGAEDECARDSPRAKGSYG